MKLKNVLIVVKDIDRARKFYHDLFGLDDRSQNAHVNACVNQAHKRQLDDK